jgi:hypothetical protein
MLARDDVIDLKRAQRNRGRQMAIFATIPGTPPDQPLQRYLHPSPSARFGQNLPCLGLHDFHGNPDSVVQFDLLLLIRIQTTLLRKRRKLVHTINVRLPKLELQNDLRLRWR